MPLQDKYENIEGNQVRFGCMDQTSNGSDQAVRLIAAGTLPGAIACGFFPGGTSRWPAYQAPVLPSLSFLSGTPPLP